MVGRFQGPGRHGVTGAWRKYLGARTVVGDHAISAFRLAERGDEKGVAGHGEVAGGFVAADRDRDCRRRGSGRR